MSLLMIVPSRNRPENIRRLMYAWEHTMTEPDTSILVCVDSDDENLAEYQGLGVPIRVGQPSRIGPILNDVARDYAPFYDHLGFMGDDHRPRTDHWDTALCTDGVAYGDDGIQGANLPTAVVINAKVIETLGYFVPDGLLHLFFDNFWKEIGRNINRLYYKPEVKIEHMHPIAGKAERDAGYDLNNSPETWTHDEIVWERYKHDMLITEARRVLAALSPAPVA